MTEGRLLADDYNVTTCDCVRKYRVSTIITASIYAMLSTTTEDAMRLMPTNPAEVAELARIEAVIKTARARKTQFFRELSGRTRRAETERLCILGRAVTRFCEDDATALSDFRDFLSDYVVRDSDKLALAGTIFDVSARPEGDRQHVEPELIEHHAEDY